MEHIVSRGHTRPLTEITFVEDGPNRTLLVSSAHDKLPQLRNGETGDWIGSFRGHKGAVWSAKIDALSRTLAATASGDFTAKLWSASTGKELFEFKHKHIVKSVDFSLDTLHIATACQDGLIRLFDTCRPEAAPVEIRATPSGTDAAMNKLQWSLENPAVLYVGKKSGVVEIWDTRTATDSAMPQATSSMLGPNAQASVMDMELSENKIVVACANKVLFLHPGDLRILQEIAMPSPMTFKDEGGASLSPDGTKLLAGGSDLWLREFEVSTGTLLQTYKGHHGPIRCVRYHPSGVMGASGSEDGTIRLWRTCGSNVNGGDIL